ncbi:MAG: 1,4-alpha-glucan branching enzyme, partial [Lachnospiraceae bacterium]|nr:1,4-alpha-glucan branching enzyme [Lachnospiraceae bacterium]
MTKKLYKLMNWAEIEGIIYSEEDNPHKLLGMTQVAGGTLVQFFYPSAKKVTIVTKSSSTKMEQVDEEGYFAALLPKTQKPDYHFSVEFQDGSQKEIIDP